MRPAPLAGGTTISSGITTTSRPAAISTVGTQAAVNGTSNGAPVADDLEAGAGAVVVHDGDGAQRPSRRIDSGQPDQVGQVVFVRHRPAATQTGR